MLGIVFFLEPMELANPCLPSTIIVEDNGIVKGFTIWPWTNLHIVDQVIWIPWSWLLNVMGHGSEKVQTSLDGLSGPTCAYIHGHTQKQT